RHLALAAFLAICLRLAGESFAALALPPLDAPSLLRAKAAGFLPASGSSNGVPSKCSPIACSTTRRATVTNSWSLLARPGIKQSSQNLSIWQMPVEIRLTHYRNNMPLAHLAIAA